MDFKTRYRYNPKEDLLGKGGFATVYKATDTLLNRTVAIKFFTTGEDKHTLIAEISRAIALEHPNLCRYYDAAVLEIPNFHGAVEKLEAGVMEYLDGENLKTCLQQHPEQLNKLLQDVLNGLSYLHDNGIIHRDLKPQNILIKNTPKGPVAKITDFGISKEVGAGNTSSSLLMGTIEYMAPEQFSPVKYGIDGKISTNLDLWSFGLMVYELITGESLFGSRGGNSSAEQVMGNILNDDLIEDKIAVLPEPYLSVVKRCLIKDAKQRARSAEELIALLQGNTDYVLPAMPTQNETMILPSPPAETQVISKAGEAKQAPATPSTTKKKNNKRNIIAAAGVIAILLIAYLGWTAKQSSYSTASTQPDSMAVDSAIAVDSMMAVDTVAGWTAPGAPISIYDDFSGNNNPWSTMDDKDGKITIENGKLKIRGINNQYSFHSSMFFNIDLTKDFSCSVTVKWLSNTKNQAFGLDYCTDGLEEFNNFNISADGSYSISYLNKEDNEWKDLQAWTETKYVNQNSVPNILAIKKEGQYIHFYLNDHQLKSFPFDGGFGTSFGLRVFGRQTVEFDDFRIEGVSK